MKPERIFLLLTIIGVTILFILTNFQKPIAEGRISKITTTTSSTTILLENSQNKLLVLNKTVFDKKIKIRDYIMAYGTEQISPNETIIFVNKIILKK